jgi:hypothetical protein
LGLPKPAAILIGILAGLVLLVALDAYQIRQFKRVKAAVAAAA